jgi:hypothetical protein
MVDRVKRVEEADGSSDHYTNQVKIPDRGSMIRNLKEREESFQKTDLMPQASKSTSHC